MYSNRLIGFSTGVLYETINSISPEIVLICQNLGCNVIEINCHSFPDHVKKLTEWSFVNSINNSEFYHISLHFPCNMRYSIRQEYFENTLTLFRQSFSFQFKVSKSLGYILFHPDLVDNWKIFDIFNTTCNYNHIPFAIENMDHRKKSFKNLVALWYFFQKYHQFKFIFDVQHWIVTGNSIADIPKIINEFSNQLIGIHLSGVDINKYHAPLFKTNQHKLIETLRNLPLHIPIIIESVCENIKDMEKELKYVKNILKE